MQGVGFRLTVVDLVNDLATEGVEVAGTVRNASDGSVRLSALGTQEALLELSDRISRRLERNIVVQAPVWSEVSVPTVTGFQIAPDLLT